MTRLGLDEDSINLLRLNNSSSPLAPPSLLFPPMFLSVSNPLPTLDHVEVGVSVVVVARRFVVVRRLVVVE